MKTRHSKYNFALSTHSEVRNKPELLRCIPTSLHTRRILTSHVVLLCEKKPA